MKTRIAFFSLHAAPYRDPFLEGLHSCSDVELEVYTYFKEDDGHYYWELPQHGYKEVFLEQSFSYPRWLRFVPHMIKIISQRRHDLYVFPGFIIKASIVGMLFARLVGKRYVIYADSVENGKWEGGLSKLLKRGLVLHASLFLVPGKASADYFKRCFSFPRERICLGAYALDEKVLNNRIQERRYNRDKLRQRYGIGKTDRLFLMVANMIPSRHYPVTAKAFASAVHDKPEYKFMMVGEGPDREVIEAMSEEESSLIPLRGVSFDEMLSLYAIADVYVHGGKEPASTALVIGAIAGLPLVSSYAVGHAHDCLVDGKSGFVVRNYLDAEEWRTVFDKVIAQQERWSEMGGVAAEYAAVLGVQNAVNGFAAAAKAIV